MIVDTLYARSVVERFTHKRRTLEPWRVGDEETALAQVIAALCTRFGVDHTTLNAIASEALRDWDL